MERKDDEGPIDVSNFRLESTSYEYAESCMARNQCICNIDENAWAQLEQILGVKFPAPLHIPIEPYSTLLARSTSADDPEAIYEAAIFKELKTGSSRIDSIILDPINTDDFENGYPEIRTNAEVA